MAAIMAEIGWLNKVKVIGFDLDGTLYPPGSMPWEMIEKERYRQLMEVTGWDEIKVREEYRRILDQLGSNTKTMTALGVDGEEFATGMWDRLALENYIKKDERVVEMLEGLKRKRMRSFVLSNSNRPDQIERKLRLIGIDPGIFEFLLSTVGMEAVKPDAKPFMEALRWLSLGGHGNVRPGQVLYVGDRDGTDIMGAKRVGMRTCMVWGRSELADVSCPTVYEVGELFVEK